MAGEGVASGLEKEAGLVVGGAWRREQGVLTDTSHSGFPC